MTALIYRTIIVTAECPHCGPVFLGECHRREELQEIRVDELTEPIAMATPRWWDCVHMGPWGAHRFEATGSIGIRLVRSLHVDVVPR